MPALVLAGNAATVVGDGARHRARFTSALGPVFSGGGATAPCRHGPLSMETIADAASQIEYEVEAISAVRVDSDVRSGGDQAKRTGSMGGLMWARPAGRGRGPRRQR